MARRRSKYGVRENLGEIVARNFLAYAMVADGKKYAEKLREFSADPERVESYKRNVRAYFSSLYEYLKLNPYAFRRALDPVYSEIKKLAEQKAGAPPPPVTKPEIKVPAIL